MIPPHYGKGTYHWVGLYQAEHSSRAWARCNPTIWQFGNRAKLILKWLQYANMGPSEIGPFFNVLCCIWNAYIFRQILLLFITYGTAKIKFFCYLANAFCNLASCRLAGVAQLYAALETTFKTPDHMQRAIVTLTLLWWGLGLDAGTYV